MITHASDMNLIVSMQAEITRLRELYESACLISEQRRQEIEKLRVRINTIFDHSSGLLTDKKLEEINATQNERIFELEADLKTANTERRNAIDSMIPLADIAKNAQEACKELRDGLRKLEGEIYSEKQEWIRNRLAALLEECA